MCILPLNPFSREHWKHTHCCLVCSYLEQCIVSIYHDSKTLDFTLTQEAPNLRPPMSKCELTLQGFTHSVYIYVMSFFCQWPALSTVPECLQCRHRWETEANVANMLFYYTTCVDTVQAFGLKTAWNLFWRTEDHSSRQRDVPQCRINVLNLSSKWQGVTSQELKKMYSDIISDNYSFKCWY